MGHFDRALQRLVAATRSRDLGIPALLDRRFRDGDTPTISTTLLNWNRVELLERTLNSYLDTISIPFELFIVDNGSNDGSRKLIKRISSRRPNIHSILLPINMGGDAINIGLAPSKAPLLHISENDIEYLPGWDAVIVDLFEKFPSLGQLSLFGPVPTDEEAWEPKQGSLRHSRGGVIYETDGNLTTTSILRRQLWDAGVRVKTAAWCDGDVLFPDDALLSRDVRSHGYMVAWANKYLVVNRGHTATEFQSRSSYYLAGYRSKFWLGEEGWRQRIATHEASIKPTRRSILYGDDVFSGFKSSSCDHPEEAGLWSMVDEENPEVETLELLYAVTRLTKPHIVLATSVGNGRAAQIIGRALQANGRGQLLAFERDPDYLETAKGSVPAELADIVQIAEMSSLDDVPDGIDLLLVDCDSFEPALVFENIRSRLHVNTVMIFLACAKAAESDDNTIRQLLEAPDSVAIHISSPRGVTLKQYVPSSSDT